MGMFDDIKCKYPLPVEGANALSYQTKDTDAQQLDNYEIREDGTLWHENYDPRFEENKEAPLGFYIHRDNLRWEQVPITGEVRFYTMYGIKAGQLVNANARDGWLEWSAYFADGKLNQLHMLENRAPDAANDPDQRPKRIKP